MQYILLHQSRQILSRNNQSGTMGDFVWFSCPYSLHGLSLGFPFQEAEWWKLINITTPFSPLFREGVCLKGMGELYYLILQWKYSCNRKQFPSLLDTQNIVKYESWKSSAAMLQRN